jgi:hypothetical protein
MVYIDLAGNSYVFHYDVQCRFVLFGRKYAWVPRWIAKLLGREECVECAKILEDTCETF